MTDTDQPEISIAVALFDRLTALDAIGPYETLQRLPGATVTFVAERTGEFRTDNGFLGLTADATFDQLPRPDVIVVPGGVGSRPLMDAGHPIHPWLRAAHETSRYTTSVCTGSLVLGAAGLLDGLTATTHWGALLDPGEVGRLPHRRSGGRAPRPSHHHRRRCLVGHRHGPPAGRVARRRRGGQGHAAHDRVRPPAPVRRRQRRRRAATR